MRLRALHLTKRQLALLQSAVVVLALATIGVGAVWAQAGTFETVTAGIVAAANSNQQNVNKELTDFRGDSKSAAELAPAVREGAENVARLRGNLSENRNMPFFGKALRTSVDDYLGASEAYYGQLRATIEYVARRDQALAELGQAVGKFQKTLGSGPTDRQLLAAATELQRVADKAASAIESAPPVATPYSGEVLGSYVREVSGSAKTIKKGLRNNDLVDVMTGAARLSQVFENDWESALLAKDETGSSELSESTRKVQSAAEAVSREASEYASRRTSLGLLTVFLAAITALAAAYVFAEQKD